MGILGLRIKFAEWLLKKCKPRYVPGKNEPGRKAQIDLLIARGDHIINLCEMKFSVGPFVIKKSYAEDVRERKQLFKQV